MQTRLIKKNPNRRLYDTRTSTYITLADVKQLVLAHEDFQVIDAKTSEDLTRSILLQIILEEEAGGAPMFTSDVLSQMIRFYGNAMQSLMGKYLENNMHAFGEVQESLKEQARGMYGDASGTPADVWANFMKLQGPSVQNLMGSYLDQSRKMARQMQESMQQQTSAMFGGLYPKTDKDDRGNKE